MTARKHRPSPETIPIGEKVAFLSRPETYEPGIDGVEVKETHMSWLFLAGDRVYKLKKPVAYPYLDFRTLTAREANCRAETRLNRRLAPDVYLGVARLTLDETGTLALDGRGETVDWLVVMRRLPEDRLLHRVIAAGNATRPDVEAVAALLSEFYRRREPVDIPADGHMAMFGRQMQINRDMLTEKKFGVSGNLLDGVLDDLDRFLDRDAALIRQRVVDRRIVEGHGDLRPEHVCLCDPPVIIDCLEFSRALRLLDPFDELADLALECGRLGAPWIGEALIERCAAALANRPPERLMAFYTAYRACLRARLAVRHLLDPEVRQPEKWAPLGRQHLEIAHRACLRLRPPAARPASGSRGSAG